MVRRRCSGLRRERSAIRSPHDDCRVDAAARRMLGRIGGRSYCRVREFIAV
jgi:hypothetical protein